MHYRVANENHLNDLLLTTIGEFHNHLPQGVAYDRGQIGAG
jgi:hypothetical protein